MSGDPTDANAQFRIDIVGPPEGIERAADFSAHTREDDALPVTLTLGSPGGPGTPVPEAGALAFIVVGGLLIAWRTRRGFGRRGDTAHTVDPEFTKRGP